MIIISTVDSQKFSIDGIEYFKNFTPVVNGDTIRILNTYSANIPLLNSTHYSNISVDGSTFANVSLLQSALLPVLFTRDTLGVAGDVLSVVVVTTSRDFNNNDDSKILIVKSASVVLNIPATGLNSSFDCAIKPLTGYDVSITSAVGVTLDAPNGLLVSENKMVSLVRELNTANYYLTP